MEGYNNKNGGSCPEPGGSTGCNQVASDGDEDKVLQETTATVHCFS